MSDPTFKLNILTPEHEFFSGEVESLIIPAADGDLGIMAGHFPLVATLRVGEIKLRQNGKWRNAFNSEGFIEVTGKSVLLFAQACEWPDEIDINRAKDSLRRAKEHLRQQQSINEYKASKIALARAMARLRITNTDFHSM